MTRQVIGTIRWFNATAGFGFIVVDGNESAAIFATKAPFSIGERVEFDAVQRASGLVAHNVRRPSR